MPATSADLPQPRKRIKAAALTIGHYYRPASNPVFAVILTVILMQTWGVVLHPAVAVLFTVFVTICVIGSLCQSLVHDVNLCPRDADTLDVVLDPQAAVDANRRHLIFYHRRELRRWTVTLAIAPIALFFVPPGFLGDIHPALGVLITLVVIAGGATNMYLSHVSDTHHRLYPWCPFCRRRDDGDDDQTPAPTPTPAGTA